MKKSKDCVKVLLSASVLPLVIDACSTQQAVTENDKTTMSIDKNNSVHIYNQSSTELEERLNQLANQEYKGELFPGAMCYSIAVSSEKEFLCPICNQKIITTDYDSASLEKIKQDVDIIKSLGYDALLTCSHKTETYTFPPIPKIIDGQMVSDDSETQMDSIEKQRTITTLTFKIKFSDKDDYHIVNSDIESDYDILVAFLKGAEIRTSFHGATIPLHDDIDVIKKMTGLGRDIQIPKK